MLNKEMTEENQNNINREREAAQVALKNIFTSNMFQHAHLYQEWHLHPLYWAASSGNQEYIDQLLEAGMPIDEMDGQKNGGGLHGALSSGQFSLLEYFLERSANPLLTNSHKELPLHIAAKNAIFSNNSILSENGQRVEDCTIMKQNVLKVIQRLSEKMTLPQLYEAILLKYLNNDGILDDLANGGHSESFEYFIKKITGEQRLDLLENFKTSKGLSILILAVIYFRAETIELLLKDYSPEKRMELLLMHDENHKITALRIAAVANKSEVIEKLLKGFNPEELFFLIKEAAGIDLYGKNIFHILFEMGIHNNPDKIKSLNYIIENLNDENLQFLLNQKGKMDDSFTPLELVKEYGYDKVAPLLEKYLSSFK